MKTFDTVNELKPENLFVEELLNSPLKLKSITGSVGLKNKISSKHFYRPQLALAGYLELFNGKQVQVFGNTEFFYLKSLSHKDRMTAFENIINFSIPCIILTNNNLLDQNLIDLAIKKDIAIFSTEFNTTKTSVILSEYLDDQFSSQSMIHGSFVDVYGIGILFVGKSGIGKSEIALDLVERGHRLVADDVVMLTKKRETILIGTGTNLVQHFMEIRGLGIIDVRQMFGIRSIRFQKRLEIIVELQEWQPDAEYTRVGLEEEPMDIMDVGISRIILPIFPGKNITVIAEVIAINYLLKTYGYNSAKVFSERLKDQMKSKTKSNDPFREKRNIDWLQGDLE